MTAVEVVFPGKFKPFITASKRHNVLEGGRGGGKSHAVAEFLLINAQKQRLRFLCTREIQKSVAESVHKLLSDKILLRKYPFIIQKTSLICTTTGSEFYFHGLQAQTIDSLKSFEGVDWCWIEEAQAISKKSLDILLPTIRKEGSKLVFTMNRFEESDPVFEQFCKTERTDVCHIHVNWTDNPFCSTELRNEAEICKRDNIADYAHIWEGQPLQQGDTKILSISKVRAAMERKVKAEGAKEAGVDVARFGDDRTVIYTRKGLKVTGHKVYTKLRTYQVAEFAMVLADDKEITLPDGKKEMERTRFKVDDTGVGGGVTDELFRKNKNAVPINNGSTAKNPDKYPDAISEMWFEFADMIDTVELPNDSELLRELCGREYKFDKSGRRQVESKADFKKRYGRSPDKADALLLCFYNKQTTLHVGTV